MITTNVDGSHPSPIHFSKLQRGRGPVPLHLPMLDITLYVELQTHEFFPVGSQILAPLLADASQGF